jgi:hypothetical protein
MADAEHKVKTSLLEYMGALVAFNVMTVYAFTVVAPYFTRLSTNPTMLEIIKSNKSTVDLITTAVVMFYFGASARGRKDQDTLATAVQTNAAAQAALAPIVGAPNADEIKIAPGEEKTVKGVE